MEVAVHVASIVRAFKMLPAEIRRAEVAAGKVVCLVCVLYCRDLTTIY